jgi:hypothetical protein
MKYFLKGGVAVLAWTFIFSGSASALTISPPVRELMGDPGGTVSGIVKLYNETDRDITVYPSTAIFKAKPSENGEPDFPDLEKNNNESDLASWIKIPQGPMTIRSLDWQTIVFEINVPKDAEPGGHYAAIFFSPQNPADTSSDAVSVNYKTGSLLLLSISGNVKEGGALKEFASDKTFYDHIPASFAVRVENTGNMHFKPEGTVAVTNVFGSNVADLKIVKAEAGGNVLPKSTRKYEVVWGETDAQKLPKGFWGKVRYEFNNFYLGRYTALASVKIPGSDSGNAKVSIWIIPWQLVIVAVILLLVLFFIFRQYNRWIIRKARGK